VHSWLGSHIQSEPSHGGQVDAIPLPSDLVVKRVATMSSELLVPVDALVLPFASVVELEALGVPSSLASSLVGNPCVAFQCDVSWPGEVIPTRLSYGDLVSVVQEVAMDDVVSTRQQGSRNCRVSDSSLQKVA
jgi:hypothetical protein